MKILKLIGVVLTTVLYCQCDKNEIDIDSGKNSNINLVKFPENFGFSTFKTIAVDLTSPDFLSHSVFDIYYKDAARNKVFILKGAFNIAGRYQTRVSIPEIADSLFIRSRSFGLENETGIPVKDNKASYNYAINYNTAREANFIYGMKKSASISSFSYMGSYNSNGYPGYLFEVNDKTYKSLLKILDQTLPEGKPAPASLLQSGSQSNLLIKVKTKVYVTFAGEGADQTNAMGYFIYNGSKPQNPEMKIIFPNASLPGSGGSLHPGDKVLLGEFPANTMIGWFLVPNGWDKSTKSVIDSRGIYFSVPQFNTESNPLLNQHMVQLKNDANKVVLLGFEDQYRSGSGCDNDFNDVVFYVSFDDYSAVDVTEIKPVEQPVDTDKDGIIDEQDQYPLDAQRAFNNGGGTGSSGTLAFEDLWPYKGDYDFNDLVLDYQFNPVTNASNDIKDLNIQILVRHVGASYKNGFGIELPVPASAVESVKGAKYTRQYLQIASNGVENLTGNAVIFPFDDGWGALGDTLRISITFSNAVSPMVLGSYPFNPFIVVNQERGREVHLLNHPPTASCDMSLFKQGADASDNTKSLFYRTAQNLPWVINVSPSYVVPLEKSAINLGYLKFLEWAMSGGVQYPDWYLDLPGYRDINFLAK